MPDGNGKVKVLQPDGQGQFKLDLSKGAVASVDVVDIDFVLTTKDGQRIILAGAALEATGEHPPSLAFSDSKESAAELFKSVGKVATNATSIPAMASMLKDTAPKDHPDGQENADAQQAENVAPLDTPPESTVEKLLSKAEKITNSPESKHLYDQPPTPINTNQGATNVASTQAGVPKTVAVEPVLDVYFGNVTGVSTSVMYIGGVAHNVYTGSGGGIGSAASDQIGYQSAAQISRQTIIGDDGGDVIIANGQFASGTYEKQLEVTVSGSFRQITSITISGYPSDSLHYIVGATYLGGNSWSLEVSSTSVTSFLLDLVYPLGGSSSYDVTVSVGAVDSNGNVVSNLSQQLILEELTVNTTDDLVQTSSSGKVYVLPSNGIASLLIGGAGADTIIGGYASNTIYGGAGNDTLIGGASNDTFYGGNGADTIIGGAGTNIASYGDVSSGMVIDLSSTMNGTTLALGSHSTGAAAGDVLVGISTIIGSSSDDTFIGGSSSGSPAMDGSGGKNWIDYAYSTAGLTVNLSTRNSSGYVVVGNDKFINVENVIGSSLADTIIGDSSVNTILAGSGNDLIVVGSQPGGYYDGGDGVDALMFSGQTSGMTIDLTGGGYGNAAANNLTLKNIEVIRMDSYDDTFIGGIVNNNLTMDGGGGDNWIDYVHSTSAVTVNLATGVNGGGAVSDHLLNIENIIGSNYGDLLIGDSAANSIIGGNSNDTLIAGSGAGGDYLFGGLGNDTLIGEGNSAGVTMAGGGGNDIIYAGSGDDVIDGGAGTDTLTFVNKGATGTAVMWNGLYTTAGLIIDPSGAYGTGEASGDNISNVEIFVGTNYDDTFIGGTRSTSTTFVGGSGNNWIDYEHSSSVTVNLNSQNLNAGYAQKDRFYNIYNVIGSSDDDYIVGSASVTGTLTGGSYNTATIVGGVGADILDAGGGNYWLDGGRGNDRLIGTGGTFVVADYAEFNSGITVLLRGTQTGTAWGDDSGTDTLVNVENIRGGNGDDTLIGDSLANTIWGGSGNDTIIGGGGGDSLDGGADSDWLSYVNATAGMTINLASSLAINTAGKTDTLINFEAVQGSNYNDTLIASTTIGTLDGASGVDEISYNVSAFSAGVTVDLGAGSAFWSGSSQALVNFENIRGSAGNDTLIGDGNANTIRGSNGSDVIDGGVGSDWVYFDDMTSSVTANLASGGGSAAFIGGSDTISNVENLYGSSQADVFTSTLSNSTLVGASGADYLIAGGTSDILIGDTATDAMTGDNDTLIAAGSGSHTLYGGGGDDYLSISSGSTGNTLFGGSGNDTLIDSGSGNNTLSGGAGADVLVAGAGTDLLLGGSGNDTLIGSVGAATLYGGAGNDTLIGNGANNVADFDDNTGGGITAWLNGSGNGTAIGVGIGSDVLTNIENIIGSTGNDVIYGDSTNNSIWGGSGDDTLASGGGSDYLDGGSGTNKLDLSAFTSDLNVTLNGSSAGSYSDGTVSGTLLNFQAVVGGSGNDTFQGTSANESFDGGYGTDALNYAGITANLTVTLGGTSGTAYSASSGTDSLTNIEVIIGGSGNDVLKGGLANDSLYGGVGNDTLFSGTGNDVLDGGDGTDIADYRTSSGAVTYNLSTGTVKGAGVGTDILSNIEVVMGGTGSDTFIGGTSALTLDGGSGTDTIDYSAEASAVTVSLTGSQAIIGTATQILSNFEVVIGSTLGDTLMGGATAVSLYGGSGDDTLYSGSGNDVLDGGVGNDFLDLSAQTSSLTVVLNGTSAGLAKGAGIGTDTLYNLEIVVGGTANDTLIGSSQNETLDGGSGTNTLTYAGLNTSVTANLAANSAVGADVGTDVLYNFEVIVGGNANDVLIAGNVSSSLYGGSGNDTLMGGFGNDVLDGGAGSTDVLSYQNDLDNLTIVLKGSQAGTAYGDTAGTDKLYNFEVLLAGSGNDTVIGSSLSETLDGGAGTDILDYSSVSTPVTAILAAGGGTAIGVGVGTDTLYNFEVVLGSTGGDLLIGGQANDSLYGGYGADTLIGGTGNDTLDGGAGTDIVTYAGETSALTLQVGAAGGVTATGLSIGTDRLFNVEVIRGTSLADTVLLGGSWTGTLDGGSGIDTLDYSGLSSAVAANLGTTGGQGTAISSTGGVQYLYNFEALVGSSLGDTLIGGQASDSLYGGSGNDTLVSGTGNDLLDGGDGIDIADYRSGTGTATFNLLTNTVTGAGVGTDTLTNVEVIMAGTGADTFIGGTTALTLDGGSGIDLLNYSQETSALAVSLNNGQAVLGSVTQTLSNIEVIIGSTLGDTLIGGLASDSLYGGSGDDTLYSGTGNDVLDGGDGTDILDLSGQYASITVALNGALAGTAKGAGIGTDSLYNLEVVIGGAGNDTISGSSQNETLDGGSGTNLLSFDNLTTAVTVDLLNGSAVGTGVGTDVLHNFQIVVGGSGNDVLIAENSGDSLYGGAGNDTLYGGSGNDLLDGGAGLTDVLSYASDTDNLTIVLKGSQVGTAYGDMAGTDRLYNFEVVYSGSGNDTIVGSSLNETLDGGYGTDTLDYSTATGGVTAILAAGGGTAIGVSVGTDLLTNFEVVVGSSLADTLIGGQAYDSLFGGNGADLLIGGSGNDTLDGGAGTDTVSYASETSGITLWMAGTGATATGTSIGTDRLYNVEVIRGTSLADTIYGGAWSGTLDAGSGVDTLDYSAVTSALTATLGATGSQGTVISAAAGTQYLYNVEALIGSTLGDTLIGGQASDSLYGGSGNDTLIGGTGADLLDGGDGIDTVIYSTQTSALSITLGANGSGTAQGLGIGTDTLSNVEIILSGSGNDTVILANGWAGTLDGGVGTDVLNESGQTSDMNYVLSGASSGTASGVGVGTAVLYNFERILAGSGNDTFTGSSGNESFDGGAGVDVANYTAVSGGLTGNLSTGTVVGVGAGTDILQNVEVLLGGSGVNILTGGLALDTLIGGALGDTFLGGTGTDYFDGAAGVDTVDYRSQTSALTVDLTHGSAAGAGIGTDYLSNIEVVLGGSGGDVLIGGSTIASSLYGYAGNDTLISGTANDLLDGGAGTDILDYHTQTSSLTVALMGGVTAGLANGAGIGTDTLYNFEVVLGGSGNDTFTGNGWSGTIDGGTGVDLMDYSAQTGAMTISLKTGLAIGAVSGGYITDTLLNIEAVTGGSGADTLIAGDSGNSLYGGYGDDTLISGSGNDILDGGAGNDTVTYSAASSAVLLTLGSTVTASGASIGTDLLQNVETIRGTAQNDTFIGGSWSGTLDGGAGTDILDLSATAGPVTAKIGVTGGAGTVSAADIGTDYLYGIEVLVGSTLGDTLIGGLAVDSLYGGSGDDTLIGGTGNDLLDGGDGTDLVSYQSATSALTIRLNGTAGAAGTASGAGVGTDSLYNAEIIVGGSGADTFVSDGTWSGTLDGGAGSALDILDFSGISSAVQVNLGASGAIGSATITTGSVVDTLLNIDVVVGSSLADLLIAGQAAASLYGGSGNDTIYGGSGNDLLDGGAGTDILSYQSDQSSATFKLNGAAGGYGTAYGVSIGTDSLTNMEIIVGGSAADTFVADGVWAGTLIGGVGSSAVDTVDYRSVTSSMTIDLEDTTSATAWIGTVTDVLQGMGVIIGGSAADTFLGGVWSGTIDGSSGNDLLTYANDVGNITAALVGGGAGSVTGANVGDLTFYNLEKFVGGDSGIDLISVTNWSGSIDGGAGTAILDYSSETAAVSVNMSLGTAVATYGGSTLLADSLANIDVIIGSSLGDVLVATSAYAESLFGGSGNDTLLGGAGNDLLDGGSGNNILDYHLDTAGTTVSLAGASAGNASGSAIGMDVLYNFDIVLGGSGNDTIYGDNLGDTLYGNGGNNSLYGGSSNDTLYGGTGNDVLDGGGGLSDVVDYRFSTSGVTVALNGASGGTAKGTGIGTDTLYNVEVIYGSSLADTLIGDSNNDTLFGGSGNDVFKPGIGVEYLDGGAGNDTVDYSAQSNGLKITVNGQVLGDTPDTLVNIEVILGTQGNDTIVADNLGDTLYGNSGNDTLIGGTAADTMDGGAGDNIVDYHQLTANLYVSLNGASAGTATGSGVGGDLLYNFDIVLGGSGNDTIYGNSALSNTLYGNGGNNVLYGGAMADTLYGGTGNDTLDGKGGVDVLDYTSQGNDLVFVLNGSLAGSGYGTNIGTDILYNMEVLRSGAGNDTVIGSSTNETLDGGDGTDTLYYVGQTQGITVNLLAGSETGAGLGTDILSNFEVVYGGSSADLLIADNKGDTLFGGAGADTLIGGTANDYLDAGAGQDILDLHSQTSSLTVGLNGTSASSAWGAGIGTDTLINFEVLLAGSADDLIIGTGSNITYYGGAGTDTLDFTSQSSAVLVNLAGGSATGTSIGTDLLNSVEVIIGTTLGDTLIGGLAIDTLYGGSGADTLISGTGSDVLDGGDGTDILYMGNLTTSVTAVLNGASIGTAKGSAIGTDSLYNIEVVVSGSGDDVLVGAASVASSLYGGVGTDTLSGGLMNDLLDGGSGQDILNYSSDTSGLTVYLNGTAAGTGWGSGAGTDSLLNFEVVLGGSGNDLIIANPTLATTLYGNGGNNSLYGGSGNDWLYGGTGIDTIDGGVGSDTVDYSVQSSPVTVQLNGSTIGTATGTGIGTDYLYNVEVVLGSTGNDTLIGNLTAGNTLYGGSGDDRLSGGSANDTLDGGAGTDILDYSGVTGGIKVILNGASLGTATGSTIGTDSLYNMEVIVGGAYADSLYGNSALSSTLYGGGGNDSLYGGSSSDLFYVGFGTATVDGGGGIDTLDLSGATTNELVILNGASVGTATGGDYGTDYLYNIEVVLTGAGADTLIGSSLNETFDGGSGTDTMYYQAQTSSLTANLAGTSGSGSVWGLGIGTDTLTNIEVIVGGSAADTLIGSDKSSSLYGGSGNDLISGGTSNDTLDGGAGTDILSYAAVAAAVTVTLNSSLGGTGKGTGIGTDVLYNFEVVVGGSGNDILTADNLGETLMGGLGADTLYGGTAADTLVGGSGNDYMDGGSGVDVVDYSRETASAYLSLTAGTAIGSSLGADRLVNIEVAIGSSLADTLVGGLTLDTLIGGGGNDTFLGSGATGTDWYDGGAGTGDRLDYTTTTSNLVVQLMGTGTGTAYGTTIGTDYLSNIEIVWSGSGNDTLIADSLGDSLYGNAGNDTMVGGLGNDILDGGYSGVDVLYYATATSNLTINLNGTAASTAFGASIGTDTLSNIEVLLSGSGNDTIYIKDGYSSHLSSGSLVTPAGHTLDGGAGIDTVDYSADTVGVYAYISGYNISGVLNGTSIGGSYWGVGGNDASRDIYINIENIVGSTAADYLVGGTGANTIWGGSGNDNISGIGGGDTLDGGDGTDQVWYVFSNASMTINLGGTGTGTGWAISAAGYTDTLLNFEQVRGSNVNDTIIGDSNANYIDGWGGTDSLYGYAGNDYFNLNYDSAFVDGGTGWDTISLVGGGGYGAIVYAHGSLLLGSAFVGTLSDTFINVEAVYGSANYSNTMVAVEGNNYLYGGASSDTLITGTGTDYLYGNGGDDTFIGGHGHGSLTGSSGSTGSWAYYNVYQTGGLTVDLSTGTAHGSGTSWADRLVNIENIYGTTGSDTIIGDSAANTFVGNGGSDSLYGGSGSDVFIETSSDLTSAKRIDGGAGGDTLYVSSSISIGTSSALTTSVLTNIETINLTGGATAQLSTATLSYSDISSILGTGGATALTLEMNGSSFLLSGSSSGETAALTTVGSSTVFSTSHDTVTLTSQTTASLNGTSYTDDHYTYVHSGSTLYLEVVHT